MIYRNGTPFILDLNFKAELKSLIFPPLQGKLTSTCWRRLSLSSGWRLASADRVQRRKYVRGPSGPGADAHVKWQKVTISVMLL